MAPTSRLRRAIPEYQQAALPAPHPGLASAVYGPGSYWRAWGPAGRSPGDVRGARDADQWLTEPECVLARVDRIDLVAKSGESDGVGALAGSKVKCPAWAAPGRRAKWSTLEVLRG
jgi:hypothetical protein